MSQSAEVRAWADRFWWAGLTQWKWRERLLYKRLFKEWWKRVGFEQLLAVKLNLVLSGAGLSPV